MRAAFGLVSLLVCGLIVAYLWASYNKPVASAGKKAREEASQIAGRAADGTPAADTAKFVGVEKPGGALRGIQVTWVDPVGPMALHFGLAVGDVVLKVGEFDVGTSILDTVEDTRNYIGADAYRANWDLVVERGGQTIHLPADRNAPLSPVPAPGQTTLTNNTTPPAIPAAHPQTPKPSQTPAAQPPQPKNARGAAEDLLQQLNRAQNRGD